MRLQLSRLGMAALAAVAMGGFVTARADEPKAAGKADAKPMKLVYVSKEGDTTRYKTTQINNVGGMEVPSEMTMKIMVKEVKPMGEVVVSFTNEGGSYTLNGTENALPASPPITYTLDKTGRLVSYKADEDKGGLYSGPIGNLITVAHHVLLPDKEVKPGDTWKTEIDNPAAKGKKITVNDTFVGMDKAESMDACKVKQTMEAESDTGEKISFEYTAWLAPDTGKLLKAEETAKGVPTQYGAMDWEAKTSLVKADKKKDGAKEDKKADQKADKKDAR